MDLEKLSNILGADTVKKVYEDGLSQPTQETGKMVTDLIKAARLFTAPLQLLAAYQDRLTKYLDKVRESVPEERQMEAPASISGPILERLKYLEENNYLTDLYLSLLQKSIDREKIGEAHPAFFHIIDQLSPDEAMILHTLSEREIEFEYTRDLLNDNGREYWAPRKVILDTTPKEKLTFLEHFDMYISHLQSLNLLSWPILKEDPIREPDQSGLRPKQTGLFVKSKIRLTKFGELFVSACIPKGKFFIIS